MEFKKFMDFMISASKTVPNAYDLHCLRPGAKMMIFHDFYKNKKNNENDTEIKI